MTDSDAEKPKKANKTLLIETDPFKALGIEPILGLDNMLVKGTKEIAEKKRKT